MAITDWNQPIYGKFTQYVDKGKNDRDSTYLGINQDYLKGWDWKSGQPLKVGDYEGANPYQYGDASTGYAGLNGLQDTEGWRTFGSGDSEYKAYADAQQNGGFIGQLGPDGVEGDAFFSAPTGSRFIGDMATTDPKLWKILQPYAKAYGSYDDKYGYTIPEEYYKAATSALGRWTTKGDWKGPARVFSLMLPAIGAGISALAGTAMGAGGTAAMSAADIAGLTQMGIDAGLTGSQLTQFVNAGGMSSLSGLSGFAGAGSDLGNLASDGWGGVGFDGPAVGTGYEGLNYGPGWDGGGYLGIDSSTVVPGFENLTNSGGWMQKLVDSGIPVDAVKYIRRNYFTPEGLVKQGASRALKKLFGGKSNGWVDALGGGGDGSGGGGMSLVDDGSFWGDLFSPKNLTSLGTSLINGVLGSSASRNAANAQLASTEAGNAILRNMFNTNRNDMEPWRQAGTFALSRLVSGLGPNGDLYRDFTKADMEADPVYASGLEFGRDEGRKAIERRALAGGGFDSGATLKALTRFANDYGSTKGNESFNRYQTQQGNRYNRLAGLAGTGQNSVNQVAALGTNMANQVANNTVSGGNARAASIVGGTNAITGGLSSFINNMNQEDLLKTYFANMAQNRVA